MTADPRMDPREKARWLGRVSFADWVLRISRAVYMTAGAILLVVVGGYFVFACTALFWLYVFTGRPVSAVWAVCAVLVHVGIAVAIGWWTARR